MFKLWCAGKLCKRKDGEAAQKRFRITCLWCRIRRRYLGKYKTPPEYIEYTYLSHRIRTVTREYRAPDGYMYRFNDGSLIEITEYSTLRIDPRRYFTMLRCAAIIVLDKIMCITKIEKPLLEFCEFLANYP